MFDAKQYREEAAKYFKAGTTMHSLVTELAHLTGTTPPPVRVESALPLEEALAQAVDHIHYLKESFSSIVLKLEDSWALQTEEIMEVLADKDRAISSLELQVKNLAAHKVSSERKEEINSLW
jgi:hypothetical protein